MGWGLSWGWSRNVRLCNYCFYCLFEKYVSVVFIIRCLYSAVSLSINSGYKNYFLLLLLLLLDTRIIIINNSVSQMLDDITIVSSVCLKCMLV